MCVHHWIIEPPEQPQSKAECSKCGATAVFDNYFEGTNYFNSWRAREDRLSRQREQERLLKTEVGMGAAFSILLDWKFR